MKAENYVLRMIENEVKYKKKAGRYKLEVMNGFPYLLKSK